MRVVQLYDANIVRSILMHDDILPTISDDTWNGTVFTPDFDNEIYLGLVTDEEGLIGVYRLHWFTGVTLQGHAHVLKAFRKRYSVQTCRAVMKWVIDNVPQCKKVACFVPTLYSNVKQFLAVCGFEEEGELRNAYLKNGKLHNLSVMGVSDKQMKELTK